MIYSMTGFGKANAIIGEKQLDITIRSLNSKQLELSLKTPSKYRDIESDIRPLLTEGIKRGRVEVSLSITSVNDDSSKNTQNGFFNHKLIQAYLAEISAIKQENEPISDTMLIKALSLPGVLLPQQEVQDYSVGEEEQQLIISKTKEAIQALNEFRAQEGIMLERILLNNIETIEQIRKEVVELAPNRITVIKERIEEDLNKLQSLVEVDKNRFEQELIYYIEKLDINEELHRLENHIKYFCSTLKLENASDGIGKKLQFIAQEMGREINTIGSKSNDSQMQHKVVEMKDSLEQIKEQLANVL